MPATLTATVTGPAFLAAGVLAVRVVEDTTTTSVAAVLLKVTATAVLAKFRPVTVTAVPPARSPLDGVTLVTCGPGTWLEAKRLSRPGSRSASDAGAAGVVT